MGTLPPNTAACRTIKKSGSILKTAVLGVTLNKEKGIWDLCISSGVADTSLVPRSVLSDGGGPVSRGEAE